MEAIAGGKADEACCSSAPWQTSAILFHDHPGLLDIWRKFRRIHQPLGDLRPQHDPLRLGRNRTGDLREYMSARTTELPRFHGRLPYPMACSDGHPLIVSQCLQGDILPIVRVGLQHFADEQAKFPDIECHSSTIRGSIGFNSYQPPLHLTSDNICLPEVNPSVRLFFLPCLLWRELEKFLLNGHKRAFAFE